MQHPAATTLAYLVLPMAAFLPLAGGCCETLLPPKIELETRFDFVALQTLVDMVVDVTDVNWGTRTTGELYAEYASDGRRAEVAEPAGFGSLYMLLTDHSKRTQTALLPGTTNLENIKLDLQTAMVHDDELGIPLYGGLRAAALAIRADLTPRLVPGYRLTIVGYSLGGGAAVILAGYLVQEGVDVAYVLTLGQPVVTNAAGAERLGGLPLLRLIAGDDVIPRARGLDYVQFGESLILLDGPYVIFQTADQPDISLATSVLIDSTDVTLLDHGSYRTRIASKVWRDVFAVSPQVLDCAFAAGQ